MKITAKVKVNSRRIIGVEPNQTVSVKMDADYADGANKEWAQYTPWLDYEMNMKPEVAKYFPNGKSFTVTFDDGEPDAVSKPEDENVPTEVASSEDVAAIVGE